VETKLDEEAKAGHDTASKNVLPDARSSEDANVQPNGSLEVSEDEPTVKDDDVLPVQ